MNATLMQMGASLIESRERAHTVSISNPESTGSASLAAGFDPMVIVVVALIAVALAVVVVCFVKKARASAVVPSAALTARQSTQPTAPMASCSSCGASIPQDSAFCPKCGVVQDSAL